MLLLKCQSYVSGEDGWTKAILEGKISAIDSDPSPIQQIPSSALYVDGLTATVVCSHHPHRLTNRSDNAHCPQSISTFANITQKANQNPISNGFCMPLF